MGTLLKLPVTGASEVKLGVYPLDHCEPHATCRDRARRWTICIDFTFVDDSVVIRDVLPPSHTPSTQAIDELEQAVRGNLPAFRAKWWDYQQANPASQARGACCLNNKTISGSAVLWAKYDPSLGQTTVALASGKFYLWPP